MMDRDAVPGVGRGGVRTAADHLDTVTAFDELFQGGAAQHFDPADQRPELLDPVDDAHCWTPQRVVALRASDDQKRRLARSSGRATAATALRYSQRG